MDLASLNTYLPQDRRAALAAGHDLPDRAQGAALFADISGFTALTETLARTLGPHRGAEELTRCLSTVFTALMVQIEHYEGSVIDFAGDAFTCWFGGDSGIRATATALALQQAMATSGTIPLPGGSTLHLAMKVAVAAGPVRRFCVGDPAIQILDVLAGQTLDRMAAAEHLAQQGEVVVDARTAHALADQLTVTTWRADPATTGPEGGVAVVARAQVPPDSVAPASRSPAPLLAADQVRAWIFPGVYDQLVAGHAPFLAALRPAVPVFVRFGGLDYDRDAAAGRKLDRYLRWVQQLLARYDGHLVSITIGDKGSYLYATFGALRAHDDDPSRALAAALELRTPPPAIAALIGPVQIGINQGQVYSGVYGGATRRTHAVMGDTVNVAARLMQAAVPGQILVSAAVAATAGRRYDLEPLGPLTVKGKATPIAVCQVRGMRTMTQAGSAEPAYALPLVGRGVEVAHLDAALDRVAAGQGQVLGILGAAGVGKTRLVAELLRRARAARFAWYEGEALATGTQSLYLAWRPLLRAFFGLDPTSPAAAQVAHLTARVAGDDTALAPRIPLLGAVLDLPLPDTALTASLAGKLRKESLEGLLVDCIRRQARQVPLVLVLEDAQWLDPLAADLLLAVGRAIYNVPVLLVVVARPVAGEPAAGLPVLTVGHCQILPLQELPAAAARDLVALKLGQRMGSAPTVMPALVERIVTQAEGNPFYIEELVNYLADQGRLGGAGDDAGAALELPTSLTRVILARIDSLTASEQLVMKVASILGRVFRVAWLWGVHPALGLRERIATDLAHLEWLDLTPLETVEPELVYLFKHALTQEVTYETLTYTTRAQLHEQFAGWLEAQTLAAPTPPVDLLAFHYTRSENSAKAQEYLQKAGDAAAAAWANAAAAVYYAQLVARLPVGTGGPVRVALGGVLERQGLWEPAAAEYETVLAQSDTDAETMARATLGFGLVRQQQSRYDEAQTALQHAQSQFAALGDAGGESGALAELALVYTQQGAYDRAQATLTASLARADAVADLGGRGRALNVLGNVAWRQGAYEVARARYTESLALAEATGDQGGRVRILANLGLVFYAQGDYAGAQQRLEETLAAAQEIGDRASSAKTLTNLGMITYAQEAYPAAQAYMEAGLAGMRDLGDRLGMALTLNNLGVLAMNQADYEGAQARLEETLALAETLGDRWGSTNTRVNLGLVALAQGDLPTAHTHCRESLREAVALGAQREAAWALVGLAGVALGQSAALDAATWLGAANHALTDLGAAWEPLERRLADQIRTTVQATLGEAAYMAAAGRGQEQPWEETVAQALGDTSPG